MACIYSCSQAIVQPMGAPDWPGAKYASTWQIFNLTAFALALLMVFKTNSSYARCAHANYMHSCCTHFDSLMLTMYLSNGLCYPFLISAFIHGDYKKKCGNGKCDTCCDTSGHSCLPHLKHEKNWNYDTCWVRYKWNVIMANVVPVAIAPFTHTYYIWNVTSVVTARFIHCHCKWNVLFRFTLEWLKSVALSQTWQIKRGAHSHMGFWDVYLC